MAPALAPRHVRNKIDMCSDLVGMAGFEPAASCSQSRRANQAAPHPADRSVAYRPACYCPGRPPWPWSARSPRVSRCRPWCFGARQSCGYAIGAHLAGTSSPRQTCGRSSMAEPQPSKLVMRVRFPSPAPTPKPQAAASAAAASHESDRRSNHPRATYVPHRQRITHSHGLVRVVLIGHRHMAASSPSAWAMA